LSRIADYRARLRTLKDWAPSLRAESRLPGPRGNLELLVAVADEGDAETFLSLVDDNAPDRAPSGTHGEFVAACGATGVGARIAAGEEALWPRLRALASDPRSRVREGVATGLQRIGDAVMGRLLAGVEPWAEGNPVEWRRWSRASASRGCSATPRWPAASTHADVGWVLRENLKKARLERMHGRGSRRCARGWAGAGTPP
jgi:hypothetical protein